MKLLLITAFTGLISLGAQAQVTQQRQAYDVTKIEVNNGIEVVFTQADTAALSVQTNSDANFANIITEYKSNTLKIYMKTPEDNKTLVIAPAKVYVTQKNVTVFKVAGSAIVKSYNTLHMPQVSINVASGAMFIANMEIEGSCTVKVAGGAGFRGKVITDSFKGDARGGAYIRLSGTAKTADMYCSSASLQAGKFVCSWVEVFAKNASAVFIGADAYIKANADGSSAITYYGDPAKTEFGPNAYAVKRDNFNFTLN